MSDAEIPVSKRDDYLIYAALIGGAVLLWYFTKPKAKSENVEEEKAVVVKESQPQLTTPAPIIDVELPSTATQKPITTIKPKLYSYTFSQPISDYLS